VAALNRAKVIPNLDAAIDVCELRDGAIVSFHHHLRNGDGVLTAVMEAIAQRGLKDITVAATSLFAVHAPLVRHIAAETVTGLSASFISGPVGAAVSSGKLVRPVRMMTHGGRARAIEAGEIKIDVAFVAAPTCDEQGNINGVSGPSACGVLGYPRVDVAYAKRVVAITDHLAPYPICPIEISQDQVDFVVAIPSIGNASGIVSGTTQPTVEPDGLAIADLAAKVIDASGLLREGFSFQTGAGGISLATAGAVRDLMAQRGVVGSFASGGITTQHVVMLEAGLFRTLLDVQCFDLDAVRSYAQDRRHQGMSASMYANPHRRGAVVDQLDAVLLGATEVDLAFNVNVTTTSDGIILGGSGGHADTAAGAKLAIITTRLTAAGRPKIVERARTLTTPGDTVDAVVTEIGVAVNPRRKDLSDRFADANLPIIGIEELQARAARASARHAPPRGQGRPVAFVEHRDGSILDEVPQVVG
jgi:citrate lyase subunit alpha/citrate CoA-transferase